MLISDRVFMILKEKMITQKELSKRTGIAEGTISDWKRKGLNPSADRILTIAEALEVDPLVLLGAKKASDSANVSAAGSDTATAEGAGSQTGAAADPLTEVERSLVELFRKMPEDKKTKILGYANFYVASEAMSEG